LKTGNLSWRVDSEIRSPEVRVIDAEGKQLGVLKTSEALSQAKELNLNLVEIAPNAKPPVVKIIEIGKFKYQEEKKQRLQQKKVKGGDVKEIRFSPFIAENDYKTRLDRVKEFIADRNKVRLVVVFRRQQLGSKQFGYDLFKKILAELGDTVSVDMEPKFLGKHLIMGISPLNK
jgi:translation initiation factor IF-3